MSESLQCTSPPKSTHKAHTYSINAKICLNLSRQLTYFDLSLPSPTCQLLILQTSKTESDIGHTIRTYTQTDQCTQTHIKTAAVHNRSHIHSVYNISLGSASVLYINTVRGDLLAVKFSLTINYNENRKLTKK